MLSWTLATAFSVGLAFTVAELMGTPSFPGSPGGTGGTGSLVLPASYWWSSLAGLGALLASVLVACWLWLRWRRLARALGGATRDPRVRDIWAAARLTDSAALGLAVIACVATAGLVVGGVLLTLRPQDAPSGPVIAVGIIILACFAVALVVVGWQAYGNPGLRRTVGVLWDISTFWPRATHPLAPPCYTERVIPELVQRVADLTGNGTDRVVVSGHSQGSVIAATLILQLDPATRARTRLLTHGSPLCRLYARFFPDFFDPPTFATLRTLLTGADPAPAAPLGWHNLYRPSDPIGGPIFRDPDRPDLDGDLDEYLPDPAETPHPADDPPPVYGHSDYYLDPAYDTAIRTWVEWADAETASSPGAPVRATYGEQPASPVRVEPPL